MLDTEQIDNEFPHQFDTDLWGGLPILCQRKRTSWSFTNIPKALKGKMKVGQ